MRLGVEAALVDGQLLPGDVEIDGGAVVAVGLGGAGRGVAAPGFIDLQVNGFAGVDLMAADRDGYARVGEALLNTGTTAFLPTFVTAPEDALLEALRGMPQNGIGPRVLGAHVEGPFLSPRRAGVHDKRGLSAPDVALLRRLLDAAPVAQVTLGARAARRVRADRRTGLPRDHRLGRPHRRDRRRGAPGLRPRSHHGHAPLQRDAPEHAARSEHRGRRARARRCHRAGDRGPAPRRARHRDGRLAGGVEPLRAGHRRGARGGMGDGEFVLGGRPIEASPAASCGGRRASWRARR